MQNRVIRLLPSWHYCNTDQASSVPLGPARYMRSVSIGRLSHYESAGARMASFAVLSNADEAGECFVLLETARGARGIWELRCSRHRARL